MNIEDETHSRLGNMDTYFVMYVWSKTLLYTKNKATLAIHKVVQRHYIQVRWVRLQFFYVKFPQDSVHQK